MKPSDIPVIEAGPPQWVIHDGSLGAVFPEVLWQPRTHPKEVKLTGSAEGRAAALFLHYAGQDLVLRHYHRGGLLGGLWQDRYVWTGWQRTRAYREWQLLWALHNQGLPVPEPLAARVQRHGFFYRADLITRRIPEAQSLLDAAQQGAIDLKTWQRVGACLAEFHRSGAWHADLNARNILLTESQVYVIDWDRGRLGVREPQRLAANIQRLRRSLEKWLGGALDWQAGWDALCASYEARNLPSASK